MQPDMQKNWSWFTSPQFFRSRWLIYIHANKQALSKTLWFWPTALALSLHSRRCQKKLLCKKKLYATERGSRPR